MEYQSIGAANVYTDDKRRNVLHKSASETTIVGQALILSGARSLEPMMGECAIEVTCLGFHLPLVMPK
jgi:hypothetical protein